MRLIFLALLAVVSPPLLAACFDFTKPIAKGLKSPAGAAKSEEAVTVGKLPAGEIIWSSAHALVAKPLKSILKKFMDPMATRNSKNTEVEIKKTILPHFLEHYVAEVSVSVFPLVSISWEEEWGFSVIEGSVAEPSAVLISYERIAGTKHLSHKCGNMSLKRMSDTSTDVFLYEEVKSSHWSEESAVNSHKGMLDTLRQLPE